MDSLATTPQKNQTISINNPIITMNANKHLFAVTAIVILLMPMELRGITIHWGGAVADFFANSDGSRLEASEVRDFSFELGTFNDGFTPTLFNAANWSANWNPLDIGIYNPDNGYLTGSVGLNADPVPEGSIIDGNSTNTASFFFGKEASVWVYNQQTPSPTAEWSLLSNPSGGGDPSVAWTFPETSELDPRKVTHYRFSDPGMTSDFGAENVGGRSEGDGDFTAIPGQPYTVQTFTFPDQDPIPEPSSALLVLFGSAALLCRRCRRGSI